MSTEEGETWPESLAASDLGLQGSEASVRTACGRAFRSRRRFASSHDCYRTAPPPTPPPPSPFHVKTHYANTPFVLGTPAPASLATAVRNATASALKEHSTLWWSFSPRSTSTWSVMRAVVAKDWSTLNESSTRAQ